MRGTWQELHLYIGRTGFYNVGALRFNVRSTEEAVCVFVDGLTFLAVLTLCQALKVAFNQEAVLLRRDGEAFLV